MKIALLDGHNLAFRAFYGMPELTRADGFPTGAVHGWVRTIWALEDQLPETRFLVFFDLGAPVRQTELAADYKANRGETPEPLRQQLPYIKDWTRALGYAGIERKGVEADDLIAAYTAAHVAKGDTVTIVSADKDLGQLVQPGVQQLLPPPTANPKLGWRWLDEAGVEKRFGVPPRSIPDYLALVGDTSDNIAGLAGVGPKTAAKWLQAFGSLEAVIAHCGDLNPKRFQAKVHAEQDRLRVNLEMTRLAPDQPVQDLETVSQDLPRGIQILEELGMPSSITQLQRRYGMA